MTSLILSGGRLLGISGAICATNPATGQTNFPRVAVIANGGDQSYGQSTTSGFVSYTASGPGTDAYTAMQQLGAFDIVYPLAASYEGWQTGARTKQNLVTAIKGQGIYPNIKNASRIPYVFLYCIIEASANSGTGQPYQTLTNLVRANNWWTYETAGGSGTMLPSAFGSGNFEINYTYAWNTSAGSAALDAPICGNVYGTLSSSQGPAQSGATYFASALLTNNVLDSRFTGLTNGAAPNADGLFLDNCFCYPDAGGSVGVTNGSWDGIGTQGNNTLGAYPSAASSLLARGQYHFFQTLQSYLASCNPGSTYLNIGNAGSYANVTGLGNTHTATANAIDSTWHGILLEAVAGVIGSGWQTFMTFADILANMDYAFGYCLPPQLVGVNTRLPPTDGSATVPFKTGGSTVTVSAGTALEYQMMRCMLAMTLMRDGYFTTSNSTADYSLVRWYDEFGDDSLTQVNVKRGYLGAATSTYTTLSNGVHLRPFSGGAVLFNEWGNGTQTVTAAQVSTATGFTYNLMAGTQQPTINTGAAFSSYTFADGDGLILITPAGTGMLTITNVNPLVPNGTVGTFYNKQMNAIGGVSPYTWSLVSATPNTGSWISVTSAGMVQGTPTTSETETVVIKVTDSASNSVQNTYSLIVN